MKRKIAYISGTRADFGLMQHTLARIAQDSRFELSICATGMHLMQEFGDTVEEIERAGLNVAARIPVSLDAGDGASMARSLGEALIGITEFLQRERMDIVVVLGDRGEMLAGALAALHLNIHIAHIHGGERSGTVDEPIRHAISKIAHYHFVTTEGARTRLERMGEARENIFVVGAPGLDQIGELASIPREELFERTGLDPHKEIALLVFHPVVQEAEWADRQIRAIVDSLLAEGVQILALRPNSDAGNNAICKALECYENGKNIRTATHFSRGEYLSWLKHSDFLIGNSSSGIIEAASFNTPVVNVGTRQADRERNANVVDSAPEETALRIAIGQARALRGQVFSNLYGDGGAGPRIVELLATLSLAKENLNKRNAY